MSKVVKKTTKKKPGAKSTKPTVSPSANISARIKDLGDWRGDMLARVRAIIKAAVPDVVEEWKWRGVPVWEHDGIICTGETYKAVVKLTFAKGASLDDPSKLFNASLDGNMRRGHRHSRRRQDQRKSIEGVGPRRRRVKRDEARQEGRQEEIANDAREPAADPRGCLSNARTSPWKPLNFIADA